jgi:hypothetical protein
MPHSRSSPTRVQAAERRSKALELRKSGLTFAQIGRALGCSEQRAHKVVTEELGRLNSQRAEQAAEVTRLELQRLDDLLLGLWDSAKAGDLQAVDRALKIMERRARLLGIDAPEKQELCGAGGGPLRFSIEAAVARAPEVIVLADHSSGASTAGRAAPEKWQTLTSVPAIRAGRLYSVDLSILHRYGPRVPEGLEILARMIHPEAFK